MAVTAKLVTYEEWLSMPEVQDGREEVVDGEIQLMPPPKWNHSEIIENLMWSLTAQLDRRVFQVKADNIGLVIRLEPLLLRSPDLAVFRRKSVIVIDGYVRSAPELVVEVLSPANTRANCEAKIRDYESLGVPEMWVFSSEARTVEVLQLKNGNLERVALLAEGQLRPIRFPEAVVDIAAMWPD